MKIAALGIALTLAVVLVACGDAPARPQAVKLGAATTVRQSVGPKPMSFGPARAQVGLTPMGSANIEFADGTQAPANCPVCGLTEGESVLVQRNNYGQWVVLGRP